MRHVALFRAQDIGHLPAVEPVTVVIANPMPDQPADGSALWSALPGGTLDALLGEMLARRASLLRVPMPSGVS